MNLLLILVKNQLLIPLAVLKKIRLSLCFDVLNRSEKSLGEIFTFFMLETILLGEALKVNPFDQPSVELIKVETNKILKKN